jgi:hypothetical protein
VTTLFSLRLLFLAGLAAVTVLLGALAVRKESSR